MWHSLDEVVRPEGLAAHAVRGGRGRTTLTIHRLFASVAMKNEHANLGYAQGRSSGLDQLEEVVGAHHRRVVVRRPGEVPARTLTTASP